MATAVIALPGAENVHRQAGRGEAPAARGDGVGDAVTGEEAFVEGGHELGGGDGVDTVGHRDHRGGAVLDQAGGHGGLGPRPDPARLAGAEHDDG
ncbi:MAG TPA: hypothetical protein VIL71_06395 [Spirillospora sp.]